MEKVPDNFLGIENKFSDYKQARFAVLPIPYEATTSYGQGTRNGPAAIIRASHAVEYFDEDIDAETFRQFGIATLKPVSFGKLRHEKAMKKIADAAGKIIDDGKCPVGLGGEHTVTYGLVKAFMDRTGDDFSVLQIDAHSDLRESYEGTVWSHASVMKRIWDMNKNIVQIGIRAQSADERALIRNHQIDTFYAKDIAGRKGWIDDVLKKLKHRVYITIDCDGFDPSVIPATGTPEPGGLQWYETVDLMRAVCRQKSVIGFDVVELAPVRTSHHSEDSLAKLIYKMMGYIAYR